jgi:UMF1 family MFS transporter
MQVAKGGVVSALRKNDEKIINGWAMYDWANSVYSLVITSSIFPIFFENNTASELEFFGRSFKNTALYSYTLSVSFLVVALISPLLSGIADYSGQKKRFMQFFCYVGGLACIGLFFFDSNFLGFGLLMIMLAGIGYSGSQVFYNAYLPEIASVDRQDSVSAKGFSLGYIGSIILLIINLFMIMNPEVFGFSDGDMPARVSFAMVGIW